MIWKLTEINSNKRTKHRFRWNKTSSFEWCKTLCQKHLMTCGILKFNKRHELSCQPNIIKIFFCFNVSDEISCFRRRYFYRVATEDPLIIFPNKIIKNWTCICKSYFCLISFSISVFHPIVNHHPDRCEIFRRTELGK